MCILCCLLFLYLQKLIVQLLINCITQLFYNQSVFLSWTRWRRQADVPIQHHQPGRQAWLSPEGGRRQVPPGRPHDHRRAPGGVRGRCPTVHTLQGGVHQGQGGLVVYVSLQFETSMDQDCSLFFCNIREECFTCLTVHILLLNKTMLVLNIKTL